MEILVRGEFLDGVSVSRALGVRLVEVYAHRETEDRLRGQQVGGATLDVTVLVSGADPLAVALEVGDRPSRTCDLLRGRRCRQSESVVHSTSECSARHLHLDGTLQ